MFIVSSHLSRAYCGSLMGKLYPSVARCTRRTRGNGSRSKHRYECCARTERWPTQNQSDFARRASHGFPFRYEKWRVRIAVPHHGDPHWRETSHARTRCTHAPRPSRVESWNSRIFRIETLPFPSLFFLAISLFSLFAPHKTSRINIFLREEMMIFFKEGDRPFRSY